MAGNRLFFCGTETSATVWPWMLSSRKTAAALIDGTVARTAFGGMDA